MSGIDEYFGYSEPEKKVEPKKEEKSIQERVNAFKGSSEFALGKSAEYFEETYNDKGGISLRFPTVKIVHGEKREL